MTINPQLDVIAGQLDAVAELLGSVRSSINAVSAGEWPGILYELHLAAAQLNRATSEAVTAARTAGVPWAKIGEPFQMTKQGAHQRFGGN